MRWIIEVLRLRPCFSGSALVLTQTSNLGDKNFGDKNLPWSCQIKILGTKIFHAMSNIKWGLAGFTRSLVGLCQRGVCLPEVKRRKPGKPGVFLGTGPDQAKSGAYHSPGDLSSSAATLPHYNDGEVAGASAPPCWCRLPSSSLPPGGLQQQQRRALWQRGWCQLGRTAAFLRPRLLRGHE